MADSPDDIWVTTAVVENIHCQSCVAYAQDILKSIAGVQQIDISILGHQIRIQHHGDIANHISEELVKAAFEVVQLNTITSTGQHQRVFDVRDESMSLFSAVTPSRLSMPAKQRQHLQNCSACQNTAAGSTVRGVFNRLSLQSKPRTKYTDSALESGFFHAVSREKSQPTYSWSLDQETIAEKSVLTKVQSMDTENRHVAIVLIAGMTCAACTSSVTHAVQELHDIESVNVSLLNNNVKIVFTGSQERVTEVMEAIESTGFAAELQEVQRCPAIELSPELWRATLLIEGMTDDSSRGVVTRTLEKLPYLRSVVVGSMNNSAIVTFENQENANKVVATITDLGFDATIVDLVQEKSASYSTEVGEILTSNDEERPERLVEVEILGMYTNRCLSRIVEAVQHKFANQVAIREEFNPMTGRMTVAYRPEAPLLTIRAILDTITNLDPSYRATVFQKPSLEERSQTISLRERNRIIRHLIVTFVLAIPTFVIAVVFMSLLPTGHPVRRWCEQPLSAGVAMRGDWIMLALTTPVFFYGSAYFHTKALREIWVIWRPQSTIPMLRRFYRFGSMNLLLSAATTVAYLSSVIVVALDAASKSAMHMDMKSNNARTSALKMTSTTYFDTVTFLTLFILIGKFLEAYSKEKAGNAVAMLSGLRPSYTLLHETDDDGNFATHKIPVTLLEVGDIVSVPRGACPPADGVVESVGGFIFDEKSLTGESKPAVKRHGDIVLTGTVNMSDPVRIKVTRLGGKSMLDQIVNIVREGQGKNAPIERLADRLTGYFTPAVTFLAIIVWLIWLGLGESGHLPKSWLIVNTGGWAFWSLEFAIAVFVVACPCGIGLAAPTALFVGSGLAAKQGILVQGGGEAFQEASRLDTIVFDKTGTLTEGKMRVTDVEYLSTDQGGEPRSTWLLMAKTLEENSSHPIAKAIVEHCADQFSLSQIRLDRVQEIPGRGMIGDLVVQSATGDATYKVLLGNEALYHQFGTSNTFLADTCRRLQLLGQSTVVLAIREAEVVDAAFCPVIVFGVTDPVRAEAANVLAKLRLQNIEVHMCTGDNQTTAHAVASQLDIPVSNVRAAALPHEKAAYVEALQFAATDRSEAHRPRRRIVAFVGDGTNDTPGLTVADVGIAISNPFGGSEIAMSTASFVLTSAHLDTICTLVNLSRRVFLRVKLNFAWAAMYNVCLIPVAAGVFFALGADWDPVTGHGGFRLNPVWASLAMAASSVSVVASSLALRLPAMW